jgi:predicted MFS family arabinose efflux permease
VQLAIGLLAVTMLVMAIAYQHAYGLLACLFLFFVAFNYLEASLPSLLTKTLPADSKGAGSGVFATCQFLGAALGGIVGGALYAHVGLVALLLSAFVLLVIWLVAIRKMRAQVASA